MAQLYHSALKPNYFVVTLDRSLTFRRLLDSLRKKLTTSVAPQRHLVGSSWGADVEPPDKTALALVYSTAEFCAPAWCCSAHTIQINIAIDSVLRIMSRCLRPTPMDICTCQHSTSWVSTETSYSSPVLSGLEATPTAPFQALFAAPSTWPARLKSRRPFVPVTQLLMQHSNNSNNRAPHKW